MRPEDLTTNDLETGYYAHPWVVTAEFPPVHAVTPQYQPLCGEDIPTGYEYQWCATTLWMPYVDCKACQRQVHEMAIREGLLREDRLPREKAEQLFKSWGPIGQ